MFEKIVRHVNPQSLGEENLMLIHICLRGWNHQNASDWKMLEWSEHGWAILEQLGYLSNPLKYLKSLSIPDVFDGEAFQHFTWDAVGPSEKS